MCRCLKCPFAWAFLRNLLNGCVTFCGVCRFFSNYCVYALWVVTRNHPKRLGLNLSMYYSHIRMTTHYTFDENEGHARVRAFIGFRPNAPHWERRKYTQVKANHIKQSLNHHNHYYCYYYHSWWPIIIIRFNWLQFIVESKPRRKQYLYANSYRVRLTMPMFQLHQTHQPSLAGDIILYPHTYDFDIISLDCLLFWCFEIGWKYLEMIQLFTSQLNSYSSLCAYFHGSFPPNEIQIHTFNTLAAGCMVPHRPSTSEHSTPEYICIFFVLHFVNLIDNGLAAERFLDSFMFRVNDKRFQWIQFEWGTNIPQASSASSSAYWKL